MTSISFFNERKTIQSLIFFILKEGGEIYKSKAFKLIWLSDRYHLRKFGRPITFSTYYAFKHGPVQSELDDFFKNQLKFSTDNFNGEFNIKEKIKFKGDLNMKVFSETDLMVLNEIYSQFGNLNSRALSDYSHLSPEWSKFEKQLSSESIKREKMDYLDFFNPVNNNNKFDFFLQDPSLLELNKAYFENSY